MKQLDLFEYQPTENQMQATGMSAPSGAPHIIAFPQSRNVGRVRHVATKFLEREGKLRDSYWRRILDNLAAQLERAGLTELQIEHQVDGFTRAMQTEIDLRCCYRGTSGSGDGAA